MWLSVDGGGACWCVFGGLSVPTTGKEIDAGEIEQVLEDWQKRQATGRQMLLAGVNMALQRIMAARGVNDQTKVRASPAL